MTTTTHSHKAWTDKGGHVSSTVPGVIKGRQRHRAVGQGIAPSRIALAALKGFLEVWLQGWPPPLACPWGRHPKVRSTLTRVAVAQGVASPDWGIA